MPERRAAAPYFMMTVIYCVLMTIVI